MGLNDANEAIAEAPGRSNTSMVQRDRWGRYLLPVPGSTTGERKAYTRATTLAGTLEDTFHLEAWACRMTALGIGMRGDLYAQAASLTAKPEDKKDLNKLVSAAKEAAGSSASANLGTALHRFTERVDAGEDVDVPATWANDVLAYTATLADAGVRVAEGWIERVVICPQVSIAGTLDRGIHDPWGARDTLAIGDVKTGGTLDFGRLKIAMQLAIYANSTHWWDPLTDLLHEMPAFNKDRALVFHLPVGKGECHLWEVDIAAGWEAVQLAYEVREWRSKGKGLFVGFEPPGPVPPPSGTLPSPVALRDERVAWLRERFKAVMVAAPAYVDSLALHWQGSDLPKLADPTLWTHELIDLADYVIGAAEAAAGLSFGASDPMIAYEAEEERLRQEQKAQEYQPPPADDATPKGPTVRQEAQAILEAAGIPEDAWIAVCEAASVRHDALHRGILPGLEAVCVELRQQRFMYLDSGGFHLATDIRDLLKARFHGVKPALDRARPWVKHYSITPGLRGMDDLLRYPVLVALITQGITIEGDTSNGN